MKMSDIKSNKKNQCVCGTCRYLWHEIKPDTLVGATLVRKYCNNSMSKEYGFDVYDLKGCGCYTEQITHIK